MAATAPLLWVDLVSPSAAVSISAGPCREGSEELTDFSLSPPPQIALDPPLAGCLPIFPRMRCVREPFTAPSPLPSGGCTPLPRPAARGSELCCPSPFLSNGRDKFTLGVPWGVPWARAWSRATVPTGVQSHTQLQAVLQPIAPAATSTTPGSHQFAASLRSQTVCCLHQLSRPLFTVATTGCMERPSEPKFQRITILNVIISDGL